MGRGLSDPLPVGWQALVIVRSGRHRECGPTSRMWAEANGARTCAGAFNQCVLFIHVVDELDALALVLERRVGEGRPTAVLALVFVGWAIRPHCKSDPHGAA